jgi:uncharacterized membrane-anchored protein YitT (DUF2179 family)
MTKETKGGVTFGFRGCVTTLLCTIIGALVGYISTFLLYIWAVPANQPGYVGRDEDLFLGFLTIAAAFSGAFYGGVMGVFLGCKKQ